ncbi:MAG: hypothetical protein C4297_03770 [Gemmataceae bacterium]
MPVFPSAVRHVRVRSVVVYVRGKGSMNETVTAPPGAHNAVAGEKSEASASSAVLLRLVEDPRLPPPPGLAVRVMDMASRPDCSLDDLARLIQLDPVTAGKILKLVNSAFFSLPRAVVAVDRAVNLLGLRTVRALVLSLSLPGLYQKTLSSDFSRRFWRSSILGAILARELARKTKRPDPEDDMIAALLRDLGMIILQQVHPEQYARILEQPASVLLRQQCQLEEKEWGVNHADVSAYLLHCWRLPEDITEPIRYHHHPEAVGRTDSAVATRTWLTAFASRVVEWMEHPEEAELASTVRDLAANHFGMTPAQLAEFLKPIDGKAKELAQFMTVDIDNERLTHVVGRAVEQLSQLALVNAEDTLRTREEAHRWKQTAQRFQRAAMRDPLTGLFNRAFLEEALATEFKRARRRCSVLGFLFIDLDNFKQLNDRYGHPFGDQVLRDVAALLQRESREGDIVARYGGDEFCILLSDTSESAVATVAQRLCHVIPQQHIRWGSYTAQVNTSIGGAVCLPQRCHFTWQEMLTAADRAMYAAKTLGRNQVQINLLLSLEDKKLVEEIERRLFSRYLLGCGLATAEQVREARRLVPLPNYRLGRLARQLGWISPRKLMRVLDEQRRTRKLFGEVAVSLRTLTQDQVYALLAIQKERPEDLAESLVELGVFKETDAQEHIKRYLRSVVAARWTH